MRNKLVVIINSLKVPKIKKILLYEMKFLVPNYSCVLNTWLGGYSPRSPFSLSSVLNWICWNSPTRKKFLGTPLAGEAAAFCCQYVRRHKTVDSFVTCFLMNCESASIAICFLRNVNNFMNMCVWGRKKTYHFLWLAPNWPQSDMQHFMNWLLT